MLKAYKYRIYPSGNQEKLLMLHFGHTRHVYNWALEQKIKHYEETGKSLHKSELQARLVQMKKTEKPWLTEVNSQSLLAALFNLDMAFRHFFQKRAAFPKFKRKYDGYQSFQCPQHVNVDFENGLLHLPKIKNIKSKFHREFAGEIKTVTIKRVPSGKYYASILVDDQESLPIKAMIESDKTLVMDIGLMHYVITSNGEKKNHPTHLRNSLSQLKKVQQQFSRKAKESKNRKKEKKILAKIHEKVANRRQDFIQQLSAEFAFNNHETSFAIEDLHIKGMIKNRKLSRALADSGWRSFINALTYKCERIGKNVLTINRFAPSSKVCNVCKVKQANMPLSIREWRCDDCGTLHDRDINAAVNIKAYALADAVGLTVCVKQFPIAMTLSGVAIAKGLVFFTRWVSRSPRQNAQHLAVGAGHRMLAQWVSLCKIW